MRITCPTCETSYNLAEDAMGAGGRKVRCTRCGAVWHARPDAPPADEPSAEAEWAAVEASTPVREDPTDDDWRAALDAPDERGGTSASVDAPDEDGEVAGEAAATASVPGEAGARDTVDADVDDAADADPDRKAGEGLSDGTDAGGLPATIEAEPAGFAGPRAAARATRPRPVRASGRQMGTRIAGRVVVALAAVAVSGLLAGSLFARDAVVRRVPDLASLYGLVGLEVNLRGLVFKDFRSYRELEGGTPVLVVEGAIENVALETRPVPRLRFGLRSTAGREVYAWTMDPVTPALDPGRTATFKSRLPTPPEAASDVQVRFTDRKGP